jgi:hypothetical protein
MISVIYPVLTFLFILSILILFRFIINLYNSIYSDPPKKYEFNIYEPTLYLALISYIITFLINI